MTTLSAEELKAQKAETERRLAELDAELALATRCEWTGPLLFVKIMADSVAVVSSTDVLGKAEFSGSLFRERLEELASEVPSAVRGEECKRSDIRTVEMRFDRNGETLQLIVDAMRGYPIEYKFQLLDSYQRRMLLADCDFYKLPSILARVSPLPISEVNWDLARINSASHTVVGSEKVLKRTAPNTKWLINGLNVVAKFGDTKWVEFRIQKATANRHIMFGVVQLDDFATDGYFGQPIKGVGYYAYDGNLYYPSTYKGFAAKSAVGDRIRIRVQMEASAKSAKFTVFKKGTEIGTEELSKYIAVDSGLLFAVGTYNIGDEVQIVGFGTD